MPRSLRPVIGMLFTVWVSHSTSPHSLRLIAFANAVPNVFNSILQKLKICLKEVEGVGLGSPRSPSCHHLHQIQSFFDEIDNVLNTLLSFSSEELSTAVSKYNYSPLLEQAKQLAAIRVSVSLCSAMVVCVSAKSNSRRVTCTRAV